MLDKEQLQSLMAETMQAFTPFYWGAMQKAIQDSGVPDAWFFLSLARGSDPQPLSLERVRALAPYGAQGPIVERLEKLAQLELLERVGDDAYRLTDPGRETVEGIFEAAHQDMGAIKTLSAGDVDQLNSLLQRLVKATLESPEPDEKWSLAYSRWTDPGEGAPGAVKTDQYLTDLLRFRDDAHIAAWKPHGVSGRAWEALSFIWQGDVSSAKELVERLPYRSHTAEDYQAALQDLATRGWLAEEAGVYKLTAEGKQVREKAEDETDRYHFIGWSALSEDEVAQLVDLLTRTRESLQAATLGLVRSLAIGVSQGIFGATRDVVTSLIKKHELDKPGYFFFLLATQAFEPDPVSAAHLQARGPYNHPARVDALLSELAEVGLLAPEGSDAYKLTDKARAALHEIHHVFYTHLGEIAVLSAEDLSRLAGFIEKVVQACLEAQEPADKLNLSTSHHAHPSQEYAPLAKIDQHLDDFNAFRDDAHLAAWKPYGVSGHAWEALTFVWRGDARTAKELEKKLPYRGYAAEVYAEALANLAERGWIEEADDAYQATDKGQTLRQQAEDETDRIFFAPWACLNVRESVQLHGLLARLKDELQQLAPDEANV